MVTSVEERWFSLVLICRGNGKRYLIQETATSNHKLTQRNFEFPSGNNFTSYFSIFLFHLAATFRESFSICPRSVQRNMEGRRQINRSFIRLPGLKPGKKALTKRGNWKKARAVLVDDSSGFSINHGKLNSPHLWLPFPFEPQLGCKKYEIAWKLRSSIWHRWHKNVAEF